jgi:hypothetical protein
MNFLNLKFWNAATDTPVMNEATDNLSNVIQLPLDSPLEDPAGLAKEPPVNKFNTPVGLLAAPELQIFFDNNFFGLGRHNGANYKTQEAQARGKATLVSQFQNAVALVMGQKLAKIDELHNMELQTEGVCHTVTGQLRLASTRLERDMTTLQAQIDLAAEGKGWVLAALNEYQIGFGKGLREAVDAEVLGL